MTDVADALARAEAALTEIPADSGVSAVVAGIPCVSYPLKQAWATQAKAMVPPRPAALDAALEWVSGHADVPGLWAVMTRGRHVTQPVFTERGLTPWLELPVLLLGGADRLASVPHVQGLEVSLATSPAEFLAVYGEELTPLVSPASLAAPSYHHLVGRVDGVPVACAQVREVAGTAYISAITVVPGARGRGFGSAISAAATRYALGLRPRAVWLCAQKDLHRMYGRLGFRPVDVHVQLRTDGD
ncbi:GNAT family N-acetyltransferase [Actinopolymorpha alba]|uniref:GNAT family N-acetyltransferase n=1 Tax=Actinopolymorpha alba TaxID=533267 RepID=UPI00036E6965|nr:GNAT family N-acetyltransferase [Actinopolymorpha alba]